MEHVEREPTGKAQMLPDSFQACDLVRLRHVVQECSKRADDQRELFTKIERTYVARYHVNPRLDFLGSYRQLRSQRIEHGRVRVESVDGNTCFSNGQGNPAGAGPEFEHRTSGVPGPSAVPLNVAVK